VDERRREGEEEGEERGEGEGSRPLKQKELHPVLKAN